MNTANPKRKPQWWQVALLIPVLPCLIVLAVLWIPLYLIYSTCLHIAIWSAWNSRGRDILFVYSDSPHWQEYIEANLLPRLQNRAIVLNWSKRKQWRLSLATLAFRHFGGGREFNPLAVVFRPFRPARIFRFWQPFQDFKHGRPEKLNELQSEFLAVLNDSKQLPK